MEAQSPKPKTGKRRYVRKRPFQDTPRRQAARMENLKKAVAVPKEKRYPPSAKRDAANMKNLEKAWTTPRKPSAVRVEQEKLSERLASLFPAYPPPEQPPADPVTEGEKGEKGKRENSQKPVSPAPEGVGTKPECAVQSTDTSPTSPSRIQHDGGTGDSESAAQEPGLGGVRHDADDDAGPESESQTPHPEFEHQEKPRLGADAAPADDQSTVGNRQSAIPEPRTPGPDPPAGGSERSRNAPRNQQMTAQRLHQGFSTTPGSGTRSPRLGNPARMALAMMPMMTPARNPNPESRILDSDASTGLNRGQMRPTTTINRQPAPSRGLRTTVNRQSLIPIPCYRTAPQPCAQRPSAYGNGAVTSHAKPAAKAAK